MEYRIAWYIDIEAGTPLLAAKQALAIQRDVESTATVFEVTKPNGKTVSIDLGLLDN